MDSIVAFVLHKEGRPIRRWRGRNPTRGNVLIQGFQMTSRIVRIARIISNFSTGLGTELQLPLFGETPPYLRPDREFQKVIAMG